LWGGRNKGRSGLHLGQEKGFVANAGWFPTVIATELETGEKGKKEVQAEEVKQIRQNNKPKAVFAQWWSKGEKGEEKKLQKANAWGVSEEKRKKEKRRKRWSNLTIKQTIYRYAARRKKGKGETLILLCHWKGKKKEKTPRTPRSTGVTQFSSPCISQKHLNTLSRRGGKKKEKQHYVRRRKKKEGPRHTKYRYHEQPDTFKAEKKKRRGYHRFINTGLWKKERGKGRIKKRAPAVPFYSMPPRDTEKKGMWHPLVRCREKEKEREGCWASDEKLWAD